MFLENKIIYVVLFTSPCAPYENRMIQQGAVLINLSNTATFLHIKINMLESKETRRQQKLNLLLPYTYGCGNNNQAGPFAGITR